MRDEKKERFGKTFAFSLALWHSDSLALFFDPIISPYPKKGSREELPFLH
jgi:hypothetical protein